MKKYTMGSSALVLWKCPVKECHGWEAKINDRTSGKNPRCSVCSGHKACQTDFCNTLWCKLSEELKEQWGGDPEDMKKYTISSAEKVLWACPNDGHHKWKAVIHSRTGKTPHGCPICSNKLPCPIDYCNTLWCNLKEELKEQWGGDPEDMKKYTMGSGKKVWWKCMINCHSWMARINKRTGV